MRLAFCLRGHIRDGLSNSRLKDYLTLLKKQGYDIDLFLHTWNVSEAKSSYRTLDHDSSFEVKQDILSKYFKGFNIKQIIIEDDSQLKLRGNLEGKIPGSKCPLIAWKRMWAGKFKLISHLYHNHTYDYDLVVNTRYDKFTTPVCYTPTKNLLKMTTDGEGLSVKYPQYYRFLKGVDNYYCGSVQTIYDLTYDFHYSLDEIIAKYEVNCFHEELFYKYAVDHRLTR
jgi:hypothetical protein